MQRAKDAQNSQPKDSPDIMFVKFFGEEYLPATKIHNGNTRPPALCAGKAK